MATSTDWLPGVDLTGKSWWDIVQLVNAQHGPNAVAEMANSGFFDSMPSFSSGDRESLGRYIAARQAEQDSDGVGGLLGLALGTAGFGVGGTTGASLATGNTDNLGTTLAVDAAGLGAGAGLAGLGAAAGTGVPAGLAEESAMLGLSGVPGAAGAAGTAGAVGGAASALAPTGSLPGLSQVLAGAIPAAVGAYASNQQANAYEGLARDYMNMGAPYRSKLSDLYANPSAFLNSQEVQVPVQQGTNALARALSVNGNPVGSGTALQELQNYSANQLFGRLGQEKDRLAGFGGLSAYNQAAPGAAGNAIDANYNTYAALGRGAANVFNPPTRYTLSGLAGLV